jgi:pimeloyl-ACP methyl ester carboxylesterase
MLRHIRVPDATIALDDIGSGPALLLLHGFPATRRLWAHVAPALSQDGYRVIVPDLVGYGQSAGDADIPVDMARQARWLLEMLNAAEIEQVVVIAHDVGSAAAQFLVVAAPQRVRGLVILDGAHAGEWAMDSIESIRNWNLTEAHRLEPVLARRLGRTEGMREMLAAYSGTQGGQRVIRAARSLDPLPLIAVQSQLGALQIPSLVLWGEHDRYLSLENVGIPLAALLKAPLIALSGGHFTPLDCPIEVVAALREFLDQVIGR